MNKHDAIKFFGTQVKLAAVLGITQHAVSGWGEYPPPLRQLQIEKASKGAMKAQTAILGDVATIRNVKKKPMGLAA